MLETLKLFNTISKTKSALILIGWITLLMFSWIIYGFKETHMFPTISQVTKGLTELYNDGLVIHIFRSITLCFKAVFLSIIISLFLVYISPIPLFKHIGNLVSKFRYLPLTGISFYITILIKDARTMQIWVLVIFMTTYLVTSLLSMLKNITEEEFDHARTLGCSRLEVLWEVVIKGRLDYVIEIIRQNLAIVWCFLVTVESLLAATGGLGFLIKNSDKFMNHGRIVGLQFIILLIGLILDFGLNRLRKTIFRYSKF